MGLSETIETNSETNVKNKHNITTGWRQISWLFPNDSPGIELRTTEDKSSYTCSGKGGGLEGLQITRTNVRNILATPT